MKIEKDSLSLVFLSIIAIIGISFIILSFNTTTTGNFVQITPEDACGKMQSKCKGPGYFLGMYRNFAMCVCHGDVLQFKNGQPEIYNNDAVSYISLKRKY